jgi:hypothetical protein
VEINIMTTEEQDPFGLQPQPQPRMTPQDVYGGLQGGVGGSYFQLSPEAMQHMWAPRTPPQAPLQAPPPPEINPLV